MTNRFGGGNNNRGSLSSPVDWSRGVQDERLGAPFGLSSFAMPGTASAYFGAMRKQADKLGVDNINIAGGESPLGSNQFRGEKVGVQARPSLPGYDIEGDIALNNYFRRQGLSRNDPRKQELVKTHGSSRQAFEALMRALKNG